MLEKQYYFVAFKRRLIFFQYEGDELQIVRLLHGAQDIPAAFQKETEQ